MIPDMSEIENKLYWTKGYEAGAENERVLLHDVLGRYLQLTQEPSELGDVELNPEWDRGFQAAMAIVKR
jgi:hypothetical protein